MKTLGCLAAIIWAGGGCALAEDYGLELPPAVLKSIYRDNALKVLNFR